MQKSSIYIFKEAILFIGKIPPNNWHSIPVETIACNLTGVFLPHCKEGTIPSAKTLYWPSGICRKTNYAEDDVLVFFMFPKYLKISKLIQDNMSNNIIANISSNIKNEDKWLDIFLQAYQDKTPSAELKNQLSAFFNLENCCDVFSTRLEIDSRVIAFSKAVQKLSPEKLDEFIDSFPISKQHFRRIFKQYAGTSISQYKIHHMLRSAVFFKAQGHSMTDTSISAGFYDISHAYKSHLNAYGIPYASTLANADIFIERDELRYLCQELD